MSFTMYVITNKDIDDSYWNIEKEDCEDMSIDEKCLLPTKEIAKQFIKDNLTDKYAVVEVYIYSISKGGVWEYSINEEKVWEWV